MGLQPFACLLVVGEGLEFGHTRTARARAHTNAFDYDWPCHALFLRTTSIHKTTNSLLSHSQGRRVKCASHDGKVFQLCEQMGSSPASTQQSHASSCHLVLCSSPHPHTMPHRCYTRTSRPIQRLPAGGGCCPGVAVSVWPEASLQENRGKTRERGRVNLPTHIGRRLSALCLDTQTHSSTGP
jgi:hypothetical protein